MAYNTPYKIEYVYLNLCGTYTRLLEDKDAALDTYDLYGNNQNISSRKLFKRTLGGDWKLIQPIDETATNVVV